MRGHIRAWRNSGTFKVWLEHPTVDGKRQRETFVVHGTRKEAEAKMADRISEIERADFSRVDRSNVKDAAERWHRARKGDVGARTHSGYEAVFRDYINPAFGDVALRKLTPLHIEDALAKWREAVPKGHKKGRLKPRSLHRIYATLNTMLKQCMRWGLIARNPCDSVTAPSRGRSEIGALDENRALALLHGLRDTSLAAPVHLTLLTGLRRGELLAMQWDDVDLERRVLNVRRSLEQTESRKWAFKDTKTLGSRRPVPLTAEAIDVLKAHRAEQNRVRLKTAGSYNGQRMVFPNPATGDVWDPGKFSEAFRRAAKRLKAGVTFHGLRHSFATIALRARVPMKLVSDILGHTTTAITQDLYTHVLDDMQHDAADRVGEAFAAARRKAQ
jgi:integrase